MDICEGRSCVTHRGPDLRALLAIPAPTKDCATSEQNTLEVSSCFSTEIAHPIAFTVVLPKLCWLKELTYSMHV